MFNENQHHTSILELIFGPAFKKKAKPLSDEDIEARYKLAKESKIMEGYYIVKDGNGVYRINGGKGGRPTTISIHMFSTRHLSIAKLEYSRLFGTLTHAERSRETTRVD